jgi:hypothetical protein
VHNQGADVVNQSLYNRRQRANTMGLALSMAAMVLGLMVLLWILFVLFGQGLAATDLNLFTQDTPAPGSDGGGLRNAIVGSLMMLGLTVLVSTPVGILAGIYLAEYGDEGRTAGLTRLRHRHHAVGALPSCWACSCTPLRWPRPSATSRATPAAFALSLIAIPGGGAHHREHAAPGARQPARSGLCAGCAALEGGD